jgi:hypothetical protein
MFMRCENKWIAQVSRERVSNQERSSKLTKSRIRTKLFPLSRLRQNSKRKIEILKLDEIRKRLTSGVNLKNAEMWIAKIRKNTFNPTVPHFRDNCTDVAWSSIQQDNLRRMETGMKVGKRNNTAERGECEK